jgi:hypothetical protein
VLAVAVDLGAAGASLLRDKKERKKDCATRKKEKRSFVSSSSEPALHGSTCTCLSAVGGLVILSRDRLLTSESADRLLRQQRLAAV